MSTETNKAIVRRYTEQVWNNGHLDLMEEFFVEDVGSNLPPIPGFEGLELVKYSIGMIRDAFPDIQVTLHDEIAEGDMVVHRWSWTATHRGELMGVPGTGKQVSLSGVGIHRLSKARIVEFWSFSDSAILMQQLGLIPTPQAG